jgi:superfamily II DNA or RNA helicase
LKVNEGLLKEQQGKRYKFLTEQTDLFKHFINANENKKDGKKNPFAAILEQAKAQKESGGVSASGGDEDMQDHRHAHRKSEKEEDAELLVGDEDESVLSGVVATHFTESPSYVKGGTMRPYQVEGLNWMISLYENGINGILADEMGLGKTLQTLSLLGYLKFYREISGPHLLIVPKSTLQNWLNESNRWVPGLNSFIFHGTKEERDVMIRERLNPSDFDICITSYEMCLLEKAALRKIPFRYIVIDEAHRIKNENSSLSLIVREFHSTNRMLITGTPLQNNLHELWALLNFLLPDIFSSSEDFDTWFSKQEEEEEEAADDEGTDKATTAVTKNKEQLAAEAQVVKEEQELLMQQLRKLLQPFLLRRLKADVEHSLLPKKEVNLYVGLSQMQRNWYQKILERDLEAVNGLSRGKEGKTRLLNIVMQLRKCSNHPYLFDGAEPGPPYTTDEHLVENAGKMQVLDKLLQRLKANGSRVLLFSQMSRMLDIFEDYCTWRGYELCRIDGQTAHCDRISAIDEFNRPGSDKFIFLLTTRAGGLGINLATADIVIMYDSDWNPQVDLQAQDRAHRIGQLKQVCVFRFITENTIEEKVIERALQKLRLDQLVIQQGRMANANRPLSQDEMLAMIRHGAEKIFQGESGNGSGSGSGGGGIDEAALEELLRRGEERTKELQGKYSNAGFDDLQRFSVAEPNVYQFEGEDYRGAGDASDHLMNQHKFLLPARRERRAVLESNLRAAGAISGGAHDRVPLPRLPTLHDFQFWPEGPELADLFRRETLHFQRTHGYRIPAPPGEIESDERMLAREAEQRAIDTAEPLSRAQETRKVKLMSEGFSDWTRRDFHAFLRGCEKFGRGALAAISDEVESKSPAEVRKYARVFWKRVGELADCDRIVAAIEKGETRLIRSVTVQKLLDAKVSLPDLSIPYPSLTARGKQYTPEEDEFLLRCVQEFGFSTDPAILYPEIHKAILKSPRFKFDFFLKTRTPGDLAKRSQKLISFLEKEAAEIANDADAAARKKRSANKEPWEKLAEKAAHSAIHNLKSRQTRK